MQVNGLSSRSISAAGGTPDAKAKRFIRAIFEAYVGDERQLPSEQREAARTDGLHRVICDYIAGMTDRFAQDEYKKLFHPFERV